MKKTTHAQASATKKKHQPASRGSSRQKTPADGAFSPGDAGSDAGNDAAGEATYGLAERRAAQDGGPDEWLQDDTRIDSIEQADSDSSLPADEPAEPDSPV